MYIYIKSLVRSHAWGSMPAPWPSLLIYLRVFHGSVVDLEKILLPTYHHFWPRKELWPNSALVLVWDEESEEDRAAADRLHRTWDAVLASKEGSSRRELVHCRSDHLTMPF